MHDFWSVHDPFMLRYQTVHVPSDTSQAVPDKFAFSVVLPCNHSYTQTLV